MRKVVRPATGLVSVSSTSSTRAARGPYLAALERELREVQHALQELPADYARFPLDQPLDDALRRYLTGRARVA